MSVCLSEILCTCGLAGLWCVGGYCSINSDTTLPGGRLGIHEMEISLRCYEISLRVCRAVVRVS